MTIELLDLLDHNQKSLKRQHYSDSLSNLKIGPIAFYERETKSIQGRLL